MALKTVADLKFSISGLLTGVNLNNVTNLNGAIERAARHLLQKVDIPDSMATEAITLYDRVFDYTAPTTIFGGSLLDFRRQGLSRNVSDYVYRQPIELFDRTKRLLPNGYQITFEYDEAVPIIRVATPNEFPSASLDEMNETTGWVVGGSASGLTVDNTVYYDYPASLRMLLTGVSSGYIEKTITQQDLSDYEDVGVIFLAIDTPSAANLTNVILRLGSSSANYDSVTVTSGFLGAFKTNDWTLLAFDMSTATSTGTPDWSAIDYARITFTHAATLTNMRVGGMWASLPSPHELIYQTTALFSASGTPASTITNDSDLVLLGDAPFLLFEYFGAKEIALQMSGGVYTDQIKGFDEVLLGQGDELGILGMYRSDNPSEEIRVVGSWYDTN